MRTFRRRAAVGATSLALLLAATGTSLAAVRADRYRGGVTGSSLAIPVPEGGVPDGSAPLPPSAGLVEGIDGEMLLPPADPSTGLPPAVPEPAPSSTEPSFPSSSPGATRGSGQPAGPPAPQTVRSPATGTTLGPATGPTPTSAPQQPSPTTTPCPSDTGEGAGPRTGRQLEAPNLALPWPGLVGVVLVPQAAAARPAGTAVTISWTDQGSIGDGSSLTLPSPVPARYTLSAGTQSDPGSVWFTVAPPAPVDVGLRACRDRSFVLYSIGPTSGPSQRRIVGFVVPASGIVTIDDGGGTAHFRSSAPGRHQVTLLTADDAGAAGPLVRVTISVS